jgi:hypothetical protein
MSLATEATFRAAVLAAEATRQGSKYAAFLTYAWDPANLAAYKIALADADAAYYTSVNTANAALDLQIGTLGLAGPVPGAAWTPLITQA